MPRESFSKRPRQKVFSFFFPFVTIFFFVFFWGIFSTAAQESPQRDGSRPEVDWLQDVSIACENVPLQDFLQRRAELYHFCYFIDRRVDPNLLLNLQIENQPFASAIQTVAETHELSFCMIGSFLYLGPTKAAGKFLLSTVLFHQEIQQNNDLSRISNRAFKKLQTCPAFHTPSFSTIQDILAQWEQTSGLRLAHVEELPFDCWNALNLQSLSLSDLVSLFLIGFDYRPVYDPQEQTVLPKGLDTHDMVSRTCPASSLAVSLEELEEQFSSCSFERTTSVEKESAITIHGTFDEVADVEYWMALQRMNSAIASQRGPQSLVSHESESQTLPQNSSQAASQRNSSQNASKRSSASQKSDPYLNLDGKIVQITAKIENKSLSTLFRSLENALDLTFELDATLTAQGVTEKTLISCEFKKMNTKKILDTIAKELQCQYKIEDRTVLFYAAP